MGDNDCDTCAGCLLRGVIEAMDTPEGVQRCDECDLYPGDLEAAAALRDAFFPAGLVRYFTVHAGELLIDRDIDVADDAHIRTWDGEEFTPGNYIASETNPWVEVDGKPVDWMEFAEAKAKGDRPEQ